MSRGSGVRGRETLNLGVLDAAVVDVGKQVSGTFHIPWDKLSLCVY